MNEKFDKGFIWLWSLMNLLHYTDQEEYKYLVPGQIHVNPLISLMWKLDSLLMGVCQGLEPTSQLRNQQKC